ncbi:hypothetical protein HYPSUDRAFT_58532 [Hypholoma sublateritium FD-334 SS-4]|uniref:Cytochrome P450 n=1 Tax=Hypholoma sublateritium (strain FD-334 SS-4) TaxID=945553 RepID=A0A0D2N9S4_HYPSF|nr:hypothetical protein HYPSUDRAFT_58532 [Hypholoma sublateritium FD-334 SS-4]
MYALSNGISYLSIPIRNIHLKAKILAEMPEGMYPDIQSRAQYEVDGVITKENRLPNIQDRKSMPYLEAILKEVLRWAPASPMGLFHCTTMDDEYRATASLRKPRSTPSNASSTFNPDRFYHADVSAPTDVQRNPLELAFGFGRRICPGQHVAEATIFIQMATFLAVLKISKGVDSDGRIIEPDVEFTTAIVSHVKPFAFHITRRSGKANDLLRQDLER